MGSRKNMNSWMGQGGVKGLFHFLWSNQRGSRASRGHNVTEGVLNTKIQENTLKYSMNGKKKQMKMTTRSHTNEI